MGSDTVTRIGTSRDINEDQKDLPPLHKIIKSLKDKCYCVVRYAYLKEYDYYIVETKDFKLGVYKRKDPDLFAYLENHKLKDEQFWLCVEGLSFYPVSKDVKCSWGGQDGAKSAQYWLETDAVDLPLPEPDELVSEIVF